MLEAEATNGAHAEIEAYRSERDGKSKPAGFPLEIFASKHGNWIKEYFIEVSDACEFPVNAVGFNGLGVLGAAYGMHNRVRFKFGYERYTHDFLFTICRVSGGKSGVYEYLTEPLYRIQGHRRKGADTEKPQPQNIIQDATPEGMFLAQRDNAGAIALISPEVPLIAQLSQTGRGAFSIAPYNSSHTGESYYVKRKVAEGGEIQRARLAIVGMTQPGTLQKVRERPEIEQSGFLARCSFCVVPPFTPEDLRPGDPAVDSKKQVKWTNLVERLGLRFQCAETEREPLVFCAAAAAARVTWIDKQRLRYKVESGDLHPWASHCAKLEEKVGRWAGLLHVLRCEQDRETSGTISLQDWQNGLKLYDFELAHYQQAITIIHKGMEEELAEELERLCRRATVGEWITQSNLAKRCVSFKRADETTRSKAIDEVCDKGLARYVANANPKGRPSPGIQVL